MPARVRTFCERTGQSAPREDGEVARCIYDSLALEYRRCARQIASCTGRRYAAVHIVGGGAKDALLCSLTADACGMPVFAGPVEATALGNAAVQMITAGTFADLASARSRIAQSQKIIRYDPAGSESWEPAFSRYEKILKQE